MSHFDMLDQHACPAGECIVSFKANLMRHYVHTKDRPQFTVDDTAKGGLTIFWGLFTMILCAHKHLKRYLKIHGSQIETEDSLKIT